MVPFNSSTQPVVAIASAEPDMIRGWVHQPNGRGTLDIIISCLVTVFLCSWSVLCLNIPSQDIGRWGFLLQKVRWMLFTIMFPEVLTAIAAEQWESANQTLADVSSQGYTTWTMRHAFFADMGGFLLKCPDFPAFPVDGQQFLYLIDMKYLPFPDRVTERVIWDKNKADGFARVITLVQIGWFCIQCMARGIQHLALSTFELSTLAFIWCTANTFFFWNHKPLDAETPIVLETDVTLAQILVAAGEAAKKPYSRTPLGFLKPPPSRTSLIAPLWFGFAVIHDFRVEPPPRPITSFGNTRTLPQRGITINELIFGNIFTLGYFGIHLAAWHFNFPTHTELLLWRGASLLLLGLLILYLVAIGVGNLIADRFARFFFRQEVGTILEAAASMPKWLQIVIHVPVIVAYVIARTYVIVEGFVSLRALPRSAYESVSWSNFLPHI
jgi:hypothetical protein